MEYSVINAMFAVLGIAIVLVVIFFVLKKFKFKKTADLVDNMISGALSGFP